MGINNEEIKEAIINKHKSETKEERKIFKIDGEDTKYLVSNYGAIINSKTGKELSLHEQNYGYYGFTVSHNGKSHSYKIARVVAECFIPNDDPDKTQVNHISGNKKDNGVWNLEWVTPSENQQHALNNGLFNSYKAPSDQSIIIQACKMLQECVGIPEISSKLGLSETSISRILTGKTHKYITSKYDFSKRRDKINSGPKASIPDETIHEICKRWLKNDLAKNIAKDFNIPENTVYGIVKNKYKAYSHIVEQYDFSNRTKNKRTDITSDSVVHTICKMLGDGFSVKEISEKTGMGISGITKIKYHKRRTDISSKYNF